MQTTSALYQQILADHNHFFEVAVEIGGVRYTDDKIFKLTTNIQMFGREPELGKALAQEMELQMLQPAETIPTMAKVMVYARACTSTQQSEWLPQGVFYVDTRRTDISYDGLQLLTLHGFDAMLMTEQDYADTALTWPARDIDIVREIAGKIGISVDARTAAEMTDNRTLPLPTGYTLREYLEIIAAEYLGCFIITELGQLRLVSLTGLPTETNYLIDREGNYITFGGDRILIGRSYGNNGKN